MTRSHILNFGQSSFLMNWNIVKRENHFRYKLSEDEVIVTTSACSAIGKIDAKRSTMDFETTSPP